MFHRVLNMPLSSMGFALTRRVNYFQIFIFDLCGENVSMAMFLESHLDFNDFDAFTYKHVSYVKKNALFTKIDFIMFRKLRPM